MLLFHLAHGHRLAPVEVAAHGRARQLPLAGVVFEVNHASLLPHIELVVGVDLALGLGI